MKTYFRALLLVSGLSMLLTGCIGRMKYASYYALNLAPVADPAPGPDVRTSVAVREFRAPAYLRQGPIVYRPSPEQIGFYEYHRWAVDPRQAITNAIVEHLRASGNFAEVTVYDGRADVDYIFSGQLEKFNEVDNEGSVGVEVSLSAQVTELHSGKTIWTNSASDTSKVERRTVTAIVAEMSRSTDRAVEKLLNALTLPQQTLGGN